MKTPDAWFPEFYCDETTPPDRSSVDAWLIRLADGTPAIDKSSDQSESQPLALENGELIKFISRTDYGTTTLTIEPDGSYRTAHPMPAGAEECCCLYGYQSESLGNNVAESVAEMLSGCPASDAAGDYTLAFYTYETHHFRYDADAHGFVKVVESGANA